MWRNAGEFTEQMERRGIFHLESIPFRDFAMQEISGNENQVRPMRSERGQKKAERTVMQIGQKREPSFAA
ncbi:MAG: hypothetical protein J6B53_05720 [Clostridia bacterium]|nr:hypothetical protein [Clostridia bacterium]